MRILQLKVPTMKCGGCVETIRTALMKHAGVESVEGDPTRKEITVTFNPHQLSESQIRGAVGDAGFMVG